MARVLLGLGANLGDRYASLQSVVKAMEADFRDVIASPVYETPAWGLTEQPDFLNAVVRADTDLTPAEVLAFAQSCENAAGRTRDLHWGPRSLDVDVIAYDDLRQDDPELTLPHPLAHERAFVLIGLVDVEPLFRFPDGSTAAELLQALDATGIRSVDRLRV